MITQLPTCVICGSDEPHLDEEGDPGRCPALPMVNGARIRSLDRPYTTAIPDSSARWLCGD